MARELSKRVVHNVHFTQNSKASSSFRGHRDGAGGHSASHLDWMLSKGSESLKRKDCEIKGEAKSRAASQPGRQTDRQAAVCICNSKQQVG